jgi:capsular polysaccharide transport system permease protein
MIERIPFYRRRAFWVIFGIPNILSLFYFLLIASPQFVSEASLVVYQSDQSGSGKPVNLQLSQNNGGLSLEGDYLLKAYLSSWDCFSRFDARLLADGWSSGDLLSRFGGLATAFRTTPTHLWRYYQRHVVTSIDENSSIMTLRVTGYEPGFVKRVADSALASSAQAINTINRKAFANAERFFVEQIERDRAKLRQDINQLSALQKSSRIVDPSTAYGAKLELLNQLHNKLATLNAQTDMAAGSTPNSDQLRAMNTGRQSLDRQIRSLQAEVAGQSDALTQVTGRYTYLESLIKNDQSALSADEEQLLHAQQASLQHQYFLGYVANPSTPVNPTEPERIKWISIILGVSFLLYLIVK